jgi:hypothetical protein
MNETSWLGPTGIVFEESEFTLSLLRFAEEGCGGRNLV